MPNVVNRTQLEARPGWVKRQELDLVEIWEHLPRERYFLFYENTIDPATAGDGELILLQRAGDFEENAKRFEEDLLFAELFKTLPGPIRSRFSRIIMRRLRRGARRRDLNFANAETGAESAGGGGGR